MSMKVRRTTGAAVVVAVAATLMSIVPASAAPARAGTSSDPAYIGMYGQQDPTFDGVYRQSLVVLALNDQGATVSSPAINWLRRQQCNNGMFTSFRPNLEAACEAPDSNATAMAVMALEAVGRDNAAKDAVKWLVNHQLPGGGWEYTTGWGADSNSTGLVIQALISRGRDPENVTVGGNSPLDFLESVQLDCSYPKSDRGALDYQVSGELVVNDYATAQATQALAGSALPVDANPGSTQLPVMDCVGGSSTAAEAAAGYLGRRLNAHDGLIPNAFGPGTDYGSTANAVLSLVASGYGANAVDKAMRALEANVRRFVLDDNRDVLPAAGALMTLTENATGGDPTDVDGVNLIKRLKQSITERA